MNTETARHILVVDDKPNMRTLLEGALSEHGFSVETASCGEDAIDMLGEQEFGVVITDLSMPGKNGIDVLRAAKAQNPDIEVIIITAYGTIDTAVEAMRLGARDFIQKPFKLAEIERKVEKLSQRSAMREETGAPAAAPPGDQLVGASKETRQLKKMLSRIAPSHSSVLITGPSGVGKEVVARAIHEASPRQGKPFIALNCAALAPGVLESELFGHEKGAFTGATGRRIGRFERAHTGTLFLDEVGEIDGSIQAKLLRVLQEGEFERVGGADTIKVDCRIVAATNRDLREAIARGEFREDFYYRLNVFSLHVPPLRERRDDIPVLVDHFLRKYSGEMAKDVTGIGDDVMEVFLDYPWPGNVRELENVIERGVVLAERDTITRAELPPELLDAGHLAITGRQLGAPLPRAASTESGPAGAPSVPPAAGETAEEDASLPERTDQLECDMIKAALEKFRWNKTKAAEHLGLKRTTLQYKIKKYGLE